MPKQHKTFEQYLQDEIESGHIEFRIVVTNRSSENGVKIYIHPIGFDGDSRDFEVAGTTIHDVTRWLCVPDLCEEALERD